MKARLSILFCLLLLVGGLCAQSLSLTPLTKITHSYPGTYGTIGCCYDGKAGLFHVGYFPTGTIYSFNFIGKFMRSFTTGSWPTAMASPNGITWNPVDGNLWLVDNSGNKVASCDSLGKYLTGWTFASPSSNPVGIAYNCDNGTLAISSSGIVSEWTLGGKSVPAGTVNYAGGILSGVAYIPQTGNYIVATSGGTNLLEIDKTGKLISTTSLTSHGVTNIQDVDYDPGTGFLTVVCNSTLTLYVFVYKPDGLVTYGKACHGSAGPPPARTWSGALATGQTAVINVTRIPISTPTAYIMGNSRDKFLMFNLPLDLSPMGATGCALNSKIIMFTPVTANPSGVASISLPIPKVPSLVGAILYDQWLIVDAKANAMGLTTTAGGKLHITK